MCIRKFIFNDIQRTRVDFVYNGEQWEIVCIVKTYVTAITVDDALSPIGSQSVSLIAQRGVAILSDESLVLTYSVCFTVYD